MTSRKAIGFFTDANVPDSVGAFIQERGHDLVRLRDVMAIDTPDPIVAAAAMEADRVLMTWDKDFHQQRFQKPRFSQLSRIGFSCPEPEGAARLREVIDLVEFVHRRAAGGRILMRIGKERVLIQG